MVHLLSACGCHCSVNNLLHKARQHHGQQNYIKLSKPAASLRVFVTISIVFTMPIYDRIFVPIARVFTGKRYGITMLQRISCGMLFPRDSMMWAVVIEKERIEISLNYGLVNNSHKYLVVGSRVLCYSASPMHSAWMVCKNFFYDQVPRELKSLSIALYLSISEIGSFTCGFLASIIDKVTSA